MASQPMYVERSRTIEDDRTRVTEGDVKCECVKCRWNVVLIHGNVPIRYYTYMVVCKYGKVQIWRCTNTAMYEDGDTPVTTGAIQLSKDDEQEDDLIEQNHLGMPRRAS